MLFEFTDDNPNAEPDDFFVDVDVDVDVDWGDGTAATTSGNDVWVTGEYGEFQVLGTHPYTKPGAFQIRVRVDDHFGEEYYTGFPYYYGVSVR